MGDFSLDYKKKHDVNYANAHLFADFDESFDDLNLLQLVKFNTWSCIVGATFRTSILDHIQVNDIELVKNVTPIFGDHELVMAVLCNVRPQPMETFRRYWRHYSKDLIGLILKFTGCTDHDVLLSRCFELDQSTTVPDNHYPSSWLADILFSLLYF